MQTYLGRLFHSSDEGDPNSTPYVVPSYACWHSHFLDDRRVLGRTILLNKHLFTIVGVTPPGFQAPCSWSPADFFLPTRKHRLFSSPGITFQQAAAAVSVIRSIHCFLCVKNKHAFRWVYPIARPRTFRMASEDFKHTPTKGLYGWITHTELSSTDPLATKQWCMNVLGWTFRPAIPTPAGDYQLFAYSEQGGGGIRQTAPDELPGSRPTVHVADTLASFAAAIREGAEQIVPPTKVMDGVCIAVVRAPGGVVIGFSGPTEPL